MGRAAGPPPPRGCCCNTSLSAGVAPRALRLGRGTGSPCLAPPQGIFFPAPKPELPLHSAEQQRFQRRKVRRRFRSAGEAGAARGSSAIPGKDTHRRAAAPRAPLPLLLGHPRLRWYTCRRPCTRDTSGHARHAVGEGREGGAFARDAPSLAKPPSFSTSLFRLRATLPGTCAAPRRGGAGRASAQQGIWRDRDAAFAPPRRG